MKKVQSQNIFRSRRLSVNDKLPSLEHMLRRKHSIAGREDVRLPAMVDGLKNRLKDIAMDHVKLPSPSVTHEKYLRMYTPEKMKSLISMFLPLYVEFSQMPKMIRKKLYERLPSLLFNLELIDMLMLPTLDEQTVTRMIDNLEKMRDFHIIVDCIEKFMLERRSKELQSRVKKLRGYNRQWEQGMEQHFSEIQLKLGKMDKVNAFTRRISKLLDESIFELKHSSNQFGRGNPEEGLRY